VEATSQVGVARLRLLASAIAGRFVDVAPAGAGERAWTDGATVYLATDTAIGDQLRSLVVQAALLGANSFDRDVLSALARRPGLARRYLAIEGHRALAVHEALLPRTLWSMIDHATAARVASPSASLQLATSDEAIADPPECFGVLRPRMLGSFASTSGLSPGQTGEHAPRSRHVVARRELDDENADGALLPDLFTSPGGGGGPIGRLLSRMFGNTRSATTGPPGADVPTHTGGLGGRRARPATPSLGRAARVEPGEMTAPRTATYPEWNVHRRRYRGGWCTVIETPPDADGDTGFTPPDAHGLRRALARLGVGLERRHRQLQGDAVDLDAAVEARVESVAGSAPGEAVYVDTVRRRRDLSVLLLLDVSGSAAEPSSTGEPVHDHQRRAAAALAVALHGLGDRVAFYGFRSQGRAAVHVIPLKRFDDPLGAAVFRHVGGLQPAAYTRLGAAIRHGAALLEREGGTARRLLVVVSDGFAYDHGYEGAYGQADARRALSEARRRGVGCLCLSVGAVTDVAALRRVFGTAAHATIPQVEQLPFVVAPLFRSALRSSEAQQRKSQRTVRARSRQLIDRRAG
jgi:hypothetical protein